MAYVTSAERIGIKKGRLEGRAEERAEAEWKRLAELQKIARKLMAKGMDMQEIKEITGLGDMDPVGGEENR